TFAGIKGRKAIILLTDGKDAGSEIDPDSLLYSLQESDTLIYTVFYETERFKNRRPPMDFPRGGGGIFGDRFPQRGGGRGGRNDFPNRRDNPQRRERIERKNEMAEDFLKELSDATAGRFYSNKVGQLKKTFAS